MIDPTCCVAFVKSTEVPLQATDVAIAASSPMKFNVSSILPKAESTAVVLHHWLYTRGLEPCNRRRSPPLTVFAAGRADKKLKITGSLPVYGDTIRLSFL